MSTETSIVRNRIRDHVAYVTLASPPLNILTARMMDDLSDTLDALADESTLKAVALQAEGKAFSAGADVEEHSPENAPRMIRSFGRLFRRLDAIPLPIAMAVHGSALGAGFELALMAHTLIAAESARFGQPEIRLGFFAPVGVALLPRLAGPARAAEITCSGRLYSAEEMAALGVVSRVVPDDELSEALEATLDDYRRASPLVMRMNMRMLKDLGGFHFSDALAAAERTFLDELMQTAEVREGITAFAEKRAPKWKNR